MELILNLNNYSYQDFLKENVTSLVIALKHFSSGYSKEYDLEEINHIANEIHLSNKKLYLSLNIIANEENINELIKLMPVIKTLNVDGFYIADFGILQLFKENDLLNKVSFNPVTNMTNKYSSSIATNLGVNHICLANELNLKDVIEIAKYNKGNIELLAQGYYQICNSKRPLLSNFFKNFKLKNTSDYYYIQEETRDYAYPIIELNNEILIYIDKERCLLPYLDKINEVKVKYLRIDTMFLDIKEIKLLIDVYAKAINDDKNLDIYLEKIKNTNSNLKCLDNISILKKEKDYE